MNNETSPSREHDPVTIARLERLAARRAGNEPAARRAGSQPAAPAAPGGATKVAPRRRAHPSKKSRAAALGLSLATTAGLSYAFAASASATGTVAPTAVASSAALTTPKAATAATSATTGSAAAASGTTSLAAATSGSTATTTVNGAMFSNKYGPVQVKAVFAANGSLSAVNVVQLPSDRKSVNINNQAVPVLNREALAAQSAKVHAVSGATYTTTDYVKSLQSAIDTARASGITQLV
jgi:uncharacterized protein with FMN-binding domain